MIRWLKHEGAMHFCIDKSMEDLNDLYYFALAVQHKSFSAAARATGIEKTRLSRRVANLERRLSVRLLRRSTRTLTLTEAGERFHAHCLAAIDSANEAYQSIEALKIEPSGTVRMSCPVVLAQSYLAPILPGYMATYPKVTVFIEATDRQVNLVDEQFDLSLQANSQLVDDLDLVQIPLGNPRRLLVASPAFLDCNLRPAHPEMLSSLSGMCRIGDLHGTQAHWRLHREGSEETYVVHLNAKLVTSDMRVQFAAAVEGIGVALLPEPIVSSALTEGTLERLLPEWSGAPNHIHLVYRSPRGILPSVRSLIDYLSAHLPEEIKLRSV